MYLFTKRLFDLGLSIFALILVSRIFVIVMPLLKFTGEGWIFFVQGKGIGTRLIFFLAYKLSSWKDG